MFHSFVWVYPDLGVTCWERELSPLSFSRTGRPLDAGCSHVSLKSPVINRGICLHRYKRICPETL